MNTAAKNIMVCMVVFSRYPADPRVRREAEVLERAGFSVDVLCLKGEGESETEVFGLITAHRVMAEAIDKEKLSKYLFHTARFALRAFVKLLSLSLKRNYRLIHVHNMPDFLVFTGALHKIIGVPLVLDLHDLTLELFESKWRGTISRGLRPAVRLEEKLSCRFADRLITTSPGFEKKLIERGICPGKVTLVLNSADERFFTAGAARNWKMITEGPALLYHGTVSRRFGLHVALEALSLLCEKKPGATLNIYGKYDPSYKVELEELIRKKNLRSNAFLGGFVMLDKVNELIDKSDIGIVPYLSDPFMDLALSTKVFEYVCAGLPVAASRVASITSIFDEDCLEYFTPGDAQSLAERILFMCENPEARRRKAENAQKAYKAISWPVMSERYLKTVNEIIAPA